MNAEQATGYLHHSYAASLSEWGEPTLLKSSGAWVLEQPIPGSERHDARGCYPLMACRDWARLEADLNAREGEWVSFTAVPDLLSAPGEEALRRVFRDLVRPFKTHYIVELGTWQRPQRPQHRTRVRLSAAKVETEVLPAGSSMLVDWNELYAGLVARHGIRGMRAFSPDSFSRLFAVPGLVVVRALVAGNVVAMSLWFVQGGAGYSHLTASTDLGYTLSASYPMMDAAIRHFQSQGLSHLGLGGGAGLDDRGDGLTAFKRGWATSERMALICGRVLDRRAYDECRGSSTSGYFPPYRAETVL